MHRQTPEGLICTPVHRRWRASCLTALVTCAAYQQGIMCIEVGGPVCIMTRTMGTSTLQYQCTVGTRILPDTRPVHELCEKGQER